MQSFTVYRTGGGGRFVSLRKNMVLHHSPTLEEVSNDQDFSEKLEPAPKKELQHVIENKKQMEKVMHDLGAVKIKKKYANKFKKPINFE
jgi:hypothetical protein